MEVNIPNGNGKTKNRALEVLNYYSWLLHPLEADFQDGRGHISASPLRTLAKMTLSMALFIAGPGFLFYLIRDDTSAAWAKMGANISTYTVFAMAVELSVLALGLASAHVVCHIQSGKLNEALGKIGAIEARFGLQELGQEQFKLRTDKKQAIVPTN